MSGKRKPDDNQDGPNKRWALTDSSSASSQNAENLALEEGNAPPDNPAGMLFAILDRPATPGRLRRPNGDPLSFQSLSNPDYRIPIFSPPEDLIVVPRELYRQHLQPLCGEGLTIVDYTRRLSVALDEELMESEESSSCSEETTESSEEEEINVTGSTVRTFSFI